MRRRAASPTGHAILRRLLIAGATVWAVGLPIPAIAQNVAAPVERMYDMPPQALDRALATFATRAGVSVVYETGQTVGLRSARLEGQYAPATALKVLLAGTGLAARFTGSRSAIVYAAGAARAASTTSNSLPSMALDMAEIRAPTMIGRPDDRGFIDYARRTQSEIHTMLAADPVYRGLRFRVRIAIIIDRAGKIGHVAQVLKSDSDDHDRHLPEILIGRRLSTPPPDGLRQPLRFDISADRISNRG